MLQSEEKSKRKGLIGFTTAMQYYTMRGYTVLVPLVDANKYDFVIEKDRAFQRVQVKTTTLRTKHTYPCYQVVLETRGTTSSRKYCPGDYDLLFVLTGDGRMWNIPTTHITSATALTVGTEKFKEFQVQIPYTSHNVVDF